MAQVGQEPTDLETGGAAWQSRHVTHVTHVTRHTWRLERAPVCGHIWRHRTLWLRLERLTLLQGAAVEAKIQEGDAADRLREGIHIKDGVALQLHLSQNQTRY